ncbi:MAG: PRC-barrel domain containing protein [Chloroflexi bacterium]|nr:PRC-barrel domain containing protein [Chloroflexota bacterium]
MEIPLNVDVHCTDGRCGRSTLLILNPTTEQLTHVIVREQWPSRTERLVPLDWIAATTREIIILNQDRKEFNHLDPFTKKDFVYTDISNFANDSDLTLYWPYVTPAKQVIEQKLRQIEPGELAVRRGANIHATDGRVGRVDEFVVDAETGHITHLVLREGHLWDRREITIPLSYIKRIEENRVNLNVDKSTIEALPAVAVHRPW